MAEQGPQSMPDPLAEDRLQLLGGDEPPFSEDEKNINVARRECDLLFARASIEKATGRARWLWCDGGEHTFTLYQITSV